MKGLKMFIIDNTSKQIDLLIALEILWVPRKNFAGIEILVTTLNVHLFDPGFRIGRFALFDEPLAIKFANTVHFLRLLYVEQLKVEMIHRRESSNRVISHHVLAIACEGLHEKLEAV